VTDLTTRYLGFELRSPIVASASPLTRDVDIVQRLEAAGVGAVVMPSLFEEEILHEEVELTLAMEAGTGTFAEALDYFPEVDAMETAADRYMRDISRLKTAVRIPVIASLNAATPGGWVRYARWLQEAGADAVELNLYRVAADPLRTGADVENADLRLIREVCSAVTVPIAVKVSPYYSAFANFAGEAVAAGASGLVMFNRFYQPDVDLDELGITPRIELSNPSELRLPLRWIAILRSQVATASLAATSGVHSGEDVAKALLVGADAVMMTSALLRNGPEYVHTVEREFRQWMVSRDYRSVEQLQGSMSRSAAEDPSAFERANYLRTLHSWTAPLESAALPRS
jgi:dihydroorotate dehydrogenase (fumarate)